MSDYFPSADTEDPSEASQSEAQDSPAMEEDKDSYDTFLAPKSAFGDMNPGDMEKVECVHVYEDEVELRCVKGKKGKSAMDESLDGMDKMMKG